MREWERGREEWGRSVVGTHGDPGGSAGDSGCRCTKEAEIYAPPREARKGLGENPERGSIDRLWTNGRGRYQDLPPGVPLGGSEPLQGIRLHPTRCPGGRGPAPCTWPFQAGGGREWYPPWAKGGRMHELLGLAVKKYSFHQRSLRPLQQARDFRETVREKPEGMGNARAQRVRGPAM